MYLKLLSSKKKAFVFFGSFIHLIAGATEGISYGLIYLALSSLETHYQVPLFLQWVVIYSPFVSFFCLAIALQLFRSALVFLAQILSSKLAGEIEKDVKNALMEKILSIPYSHSSRLSKGHILDLLQTHRYLRVSIEQAGNCLVMFFLALSYLGLMFFLSWQLTIGVLFLLACNGFIQKKILYRIENAAKKEEKRVKIFAKKGYQRVTFGKELYLSNESHQFFSSWKRGVANLEKVSFRLAFLRNLVQPIHEIVSLLSLALVLFLVIFFSSSSLQLLFTFLPLTYRLGTRIQLLIQSFTLVLQVKAPLEEIQAIFQLPTKDLSFFPIPSWSEIILEEVDFFYPVGCGLTNINVRIKKGSFILVMGPSGAGKSTFLDVILGLQTPQKGRILLDKEQISLQQLSSYQSLFGYVSQNPFLLEANVYQNICLMKKNLSTEQVVDICKKVGLHDFFSSLPQGYLTLLGEQKVALSGGQKARLALARVLIASYEVLVFDEPFSQLDLETESSILEVIEELKGNKTIILVAHRFSKIDMVDKIVVLDRGRLKEIKQQELLEALMPV